MAEVIAENAPVLVALDRQLFELWHAGHARAADDRAGGNPATRGKDGLLNGGTGKPGVGDEFKMRILRQLFFCVCDELRLMRAKLRQDVLSRTNENHFDFINGNPAEVTARHGRQKFTQLTGDFDSSVIAADDHESQQALAFGRVRLHVGQLKHADEVVAHSQTARVGLETE